MWNDRLVAAVRDYSSGVLSSVEPSGYPTSVRCTARVDAERRVVVISPVPPVAQGWQGKACLLFHMHDEHLEGLRQLVLKGELAAEDGTLVLRNVEFVTANGRANTDVMPHAGAPLHMLQFLLLGRRKAREYMQKRGTPWPPIPFEEIERAMDGP
ncbi:MAG: hypothetical protein M3437_01180 [Chloroflexota bacterium]|nr:hypothetical protein [Chloroflexota bacterium]MDQ5865270.1 hypothetical protein [Chloroflexota bacterium]